MPTTTLAATLAAKFNLPAPEVERALQLREEARRRQLEQEEGVGHDGKRQSSKRFVGVLE